MILPPSAPSMSRSVSGRRKGAHISAPSDGLLGTGALVPVNGFVPEVVNGSLGNRNNGTLSNGKINGAQNEGTVERVADGLLGTHNNNGVFSNGPSRGSNSLLGGGSGS